MAWVGKLSLGLVYPFSLSTNGERAKRERGVLVDSVHKGTMYGMASHGSWDRHMSFFR